LAPAFLKDHGLKSVPKSVAYGYAASGYGFVPDMPYAYVHECHHAFKFYSFFAFPFIITSIFYTCLRIFSVPTVEGLRQVGTFAAQQHIYWYFRNNQP
jgi:hypothetical protein